MMTSKKGRRPQQKNGRRPQQKWKTTSTEMEDKLKKMNVQPQAQLKKSTLIGCDIIVN
jgi:hypothetical protein